jgi:hypothetical protein
MDEKIKIELESNNYIKNNHVDHLFVLKNYGKCVEFLNEMTQTIGITPAEHECLDKVSRRKVKWESRGGHWTGIALAILQARYFVRTKYAVMKLLLAFSYPIFCFDIYYNLGRQIGNFLVMPKNLNDLLSLYNANDKRSIQSMQTHLFVKRCVYDEILVRNQQTESEPWANSYFVTQVFGKSYLRIKKFKKAVLSFQNKGRFVDSNSNNIDEK